MQPHVCGVEKVWQRVALLLMIASPLTASYTASLFSAGIYKVLTEIFHQDQTGEMRSSLHFHTAHL